VYFNVNFNVFFKLIKVHLLVSELYIYQNARCNNKKKYWLYNSGSQTSSKSVYSRAIIIHLPKLSLLNLKYDTYSLMISKNIPPNLSF